MNTKTLLGISLGAAFLLSPYCLSARQDQAQDQGQGQESVADAARKAQEAKKTAPKPKMVIDNDNLSSLTGTISVVGELPAPPAEAEKAAAEKPKSDKTLVKDESYWRGVFDAANKKLADDAHELDILQREYNLKQQQYYSDPNQALKEEYTRQDLNDQKQKIDDKTAMVAQDKQDISDLEDELRQSGGDPGWERQTPAQSQAEVPETPPLPPPPESPTQPSAQSPVQSPMR